MRIAQQPQASQDKQSQQKKMKCGLKIRGDENLERKGSARVLRKMKR